MTTPGYAKFLGKNGYDLELKRALKILEIGREYKVLGGDIGQSYTSYKLEGFDGSFNSAMFDADWETLPLKNPYAEMFSPRVKPVVDKSEAIEVIKAPLFDEPPIAKNTTWCVLLRLKENGDWESLGCVDSNNVPDDITEDFDICLPIPDPKNLNEFDGW